VAALQARANGSAAEGEATALVRQVVEASGDAGAAG
jgi:hypothetical protein